MKRVISLIIALAAIVSFALAAAADESGMSVYAGKAETDSLMKNAAGTMLGKSLTEFGISVDTETVMPLYYASLYDYGESGSFSYEPYMSDGYRLYAADALNSENEFAGTLIFSAEDILMYSPSADKADSPDLKAESGSRIAKLTGIGTDDLIKAAKLMFVDGAGYVYYVNDGSKELLVSANLKGTNEELFTEKSQGTVAVDNDLFIFAKALAEEQKSRTEALQNLAPGENPMTGVETAAYDAERDFPYKTVSWILPAALIVFALAYAKRKCKRH